MWMSRLLIFMFVAGCASGTEVDLTEVTDGPTSAAVHVLGEAPDEVETLTLVPDAGREQEPDAAPEPVQQTPRVVATGLPLTQMTCDGDVAYWATGAGNVMRTSLVNGDTSIIAVAVVPSPVTMFMGAGEVVLQGFRMARVDPATGHARYEASPHIRDSASGSTGYVWYDGLTLWWAGPPLHTTTIGAAEALAPAIYGPRWIHDGRLYGLSLENRPEIQDGGGGGRFVSSRGMAEIDLGILWGSELGLHWLKRDGSQQNFPEPTSLVAAVGDSVARRVDGRVLTRNLATGDEESFVETGNVVSLATCGNHAVWATADGRVTTVEMP